MTAELRQRGPDEVCVVCGALDCAGRPYARPRVLFVTRLIDLLAGVFQRRSGVAFETRCPRCGTRNVL